MKKFLALLLVVCMLVPFAAFADGAIKLGQVEWAAHGTKCFAVVTAVVQDDVIVAAYIDEFQFMAAGSIGVPNSDADFGTAYPEGKVLASKRANAEAYSTNMQKAGSTVALNVNYDIIQAYCVGKTVAELEEAINGMTKETAVDAVSGATLVDTYGYLQGILEAAKAAK